MVFRNIHRYLLDINECLTNPCHTDAVCTNTIGGHFCTCNNGYVGNGLQCSGMYFRIISYAGTFKIL